MFNSFSRIIVNTNKYFLLLFLLLNSTCSVTDFEFYSYENIPDRPEVGYQRADIFPNYFKVMTGSVFISALKTRSLWLPHDTSFKEVYPHLNVELIAFNQLPGKSYTWQERLIFADALELILLVVNSPYFLEEMEIESFAEPFYNNDRTKTLSAKEVVDSIRSAKLDFFLGKDRLGENVLAQATLGGVQNTIWFRDDVDYQTARLCSIAVILFHEMTHNLGYKHSSNVPYGVQEPLLRTISRLKGNDVHEFISLTPYYETDFLTRVRENSSLNSTKNSHNVKINVDYVDDIGEEFVN